MEPQKANKDILAVIHHSLAVMENLRIKAEEEGTGLLRVLAMIFNIPVEEAPHLGVLVDAAGQATIYDSRTHYNNNGKVEAIGPQPEPLPEAPLSVEPAVHTALFDRWVNEPSLDDARALTDEEAALIRDQIERDNIATMLDEGEDFFALVA